MPQKDQRSELKAKIAEYLLTQGIDGESPIPGKRLRDELAEIVLHDCLDWVPARVEELGQQFDYLIGFAFGHRFQDNGNRSSGPVNKELAEILTTKYEAHDPGSRPEVWAQWEIAEHLKGTKVEGEGNLKPVYPDISITLDKVDYASTVTVTKKIRSTLGPNDMPSALLVAHPDHSRRCLRVVGSFRFNAYAVDHERTRISDWYDKDSGLMWTRNRHLYLLHDMLGALRFSRDRASDYGKT